MTTSSLPWLYKAARNIYSMMSDRGYFEVDNQEESHSDNPEYYITFSTVEQSFAKFKKYCETELADFSIDELKKSITRLFYNEKTGKYIYLLWHLENLGISEVKNIVTELETFKKDGIDIDTMVIICSKNITTTGNDAFRLVERTRSVTVTIFMEEQIGHDPTKHEYVPTHTILTTKKKKQILKMFALEQCQCPEISKDDPVAKWMGVKVGQMIKIVSIERTLDGHPLTRTSFRIVK